MNSANTQQNISQHLTKFRTKREQKNSIRNKLYSQYTTKCCICEHWGSLGTFCKHPVLYSSIPISTLLSKAHVLFDSENLRFFQKYLHIKIVFSIRNVLLLLWQGTTKCLCVLPVLRNEKRRNK